MKLVTVVKCILLAPSPTFVVHAKESPTSSLIFLWDLTHCPVLRRQDTEYMRWRLQPLLWALLYLEELPLMSKVHGPSAPLLLHCARANQLLSRNSNNGSDPLVHPRFQSLPGVPASIPTFLVLCLILPRTLDLAVLIWITFANRRSNLSSADTGLRQRSFRTSFGTLESQSFLTLLCLLQFRPRVFTSGKEISMKICGLNTVTAVGAIWGKRQLSGTSCNCGFHTSSSPI